MSLPLAESPVQPEERDGTPRLELVWTMVLKQASGQLSESAYAMWFGELEPLSLEGTELRIEAPSAYVANRLTSRYRDVLVSAARTALGPEATIRVVAAPPEDHPAADPAHTVGGGTERFDPTDSSAPPSPSDGPLAGPLPRRGAPGDPPASQVTRHGQDGPAAVRRPRRSARAGRPDPGQARLDDPDVGASPFPDRYTFESFVPGPSNKFAHAAAMAVAEGAPSRVYNPLFVYGGVGLGKTHLLFAIGNHMVCLAPRTRVRYVTSESFMTEFIRAVREGRGYLFQRQYRDVEVLLLDDIQFLTRAEETQREFFHTFNHLHQHERQVVIASDRPPQELGGIEERLRSRFRSGLVVDVQPPDLETRIAILQLKARRDGMRIPAPVLHFIASRFDSNIRELEGALLRVVAFASLSRETMDLRLAEHALEDLLPQSDREILPSLVVDETAVYFGLEREDLISKSRSRPLTTARHVAMYLLRELTGLSLIKIGEQFDRDHTTALHGIKKIEALMPARGSVYRQVQDLTKRIRATGQAR
jgi:chromosomal replication initiator protein